MKIRITLGVAAAVAGMFGSGCNCGEPAPAASCTPGTVTISSPPDFSSSGEKVTADEDDSLPGVQVTLQATADGVPDGTTFTVNVNGTDWLVPAMVQGGAISLEGLTLANGNNSVAISGTQCSSPVSDTISVVVEVPAAGTCEFTDPADGQALGAANDLDRAVAGLQYDVVASCTDATPGGAAALLVDGVEVATATFGNTGTVTFPGATLPEGTVTLGLNSSAGTDEISVTVDLTLPDILLGLPIDVGLADDADGDASNGLQATARVEGAALADGDAVEVDCGGGVVRSGVISGGAALIELSFSPEDCLGVDYGCVARSAALPGVTSNLATIHADDEAPVIVLTAPDPADLACSATPLVAAGVTCLEPGLRVALLKLEPDDARTPIADAVEPVGGVATWPDGAIYPGALAEGGYSLILETQDGSGNAVELSWAVVVDVTAPAPSFRTPTQDQRWVQADDADADASNGFQHDVTVELPGERDGVAVTIVARSGGLDVAGPYAGVVEAGIVTFLAVDLPADRFTLVATVDDGCSPVATATVDVFVDNGQAQCSLLLPVNGLVTGSATLLVEVQTTVPAGVPIVIDGVGPAGQPVVFGSFPAGAGATTSGSVQLAAGDGGYTVAAHCGAATSPAKQVELDTAIPVLGVSVPVAAGGWVNQSAFDSDPAQPGFQIDVVVTADAIQDGSSGTLDVTCDDGAADSRPLTFTGGVATAAALASDDASCTYTASAADAAGNAAVPVALVLGIDLAAPGVGPCTPSGGRIVGAPVQVVCTVTGGTTGDAAEVFEGAAQHFGGALGADPTTFSTGALALADGAHLLTIRVTDAAGNVVPVNITFTVDTQAPTISITSPVSGTVRTRISDFNPATPEVEAEFVVQTSGANAGDEFWLCSALGTGGACPAGGGLRVDGQVTAVSGPVTNRILGFADGVHDLYACVSDGVNPPFCSPGGHLFTVDGTPPVVTSLVLEDDASGDGQLNAAELAAGGGLVRVRALVTGADGRTLTLSSGALLGSAQVLAGDTGPISLALGDGAHTLTADVTDALGNPNRRAAAPAISNPASIRDISVDGAAPQIAWISPTAGAFVSGAPLTLRVSSDAGQGQFVSLRVDGGVVCSPAIQVNGQASCTAAVADGLHTFRADVVDAAANFGTAQVSATVDNTAPTLAFTSPLGGQAFGASQVPVVFATTGLPAGRTISFTSSARPGTFTATVLADGSASTTVSLNDGALQTLSASVSDEAGNPASAVSGAFTVASVGCSLFFTTPIGNAVTYLVGSDQVPGGDLQTTVTLATNCPDGSAATISVDGGAPLAGSASGGTIVLTITIADGAVSVPVVAEVTNAGGLTTQADYFATVDLEAPAFSSALPAGSFSLVAPGNAAINGTTTFSDKTAGLAATLDLTYGVTGAAGGTIALTLAGSPVSSQGIATASETVTFADVIFNQGTTEAYSIELRDAAGNVVTRGGNVTTDVLAPAAAAAPVLTLADVRAATGSFAFGAPAGDDATGTGTAASYEIRWSFSVITPANFVTANLVTPPAPAAPGTPQLATFSTTPLGTYNACIRATDAAGNIGPLSCGSTGHGWAVSEYSGSAPNQFYAFQVLYVGDVGSPIGGALAGAADGYGDFVVSNSGAGGNAGAFHLFYGGPDLAALSSITLTGTGTEQFGSRFAAGDFDGDGLTDLLVSRSTFQSNRGRATIFFGGAGGFSTSRQVELRNAPGLTSRFARALANVGDVGSAAMSSIPDGIDDLFIGAYEEGVVGPGTGYVFFGRSRANWIAAASTCEGADCFVPTADAAGVGGRTFVGDANGDRLGFRNGAGTLGDLDGDGFGEFAIPSSAVSRLGLFDGAVVAGAQGVTLRPGTNAMEVRTEAGALPGTFYDGFGQALLGGLDFTGDAYPDLVVSDAHNNRVYVYPGDDTTDSIPAVASQTFTVGASTKFGWELVGADVTGDGALDLLVGSNGSGTNLVSIFKNLGPGQAPFATPGSRLTGAGLFGTGIAVGDLDNDGDLEVVVGASADGNGKVFIYSP